MRERPQVHHPRVPLGCDQQGRYPEASEGDFEWKLSELMVPIAVIACSLVLSILLLGNMIR